MNDSVTLILSYLSSANFLRAAGMTLALTVCSMLLGMLIGLIVALLQERRNRLVRALVMLYLWLFRGTPVLLQIIFIFNVLPNFGILLSGFTSGVIALALNEGAYMAEIYRSGLQSVGARQRTAGYALGMRGWQVMRYVVLPQAMKVVIPPTGNQFMGMLKNSALVSVIAVEELLLVADQTASANFRYLESLTAAAVYYLIMTTLFMLIQQLIEQRFKTQRSQEAPRSWSQRFLRMTRA
ncbi:amino acid ABC transporter permease [Salinicola rhizosphaerae]|uniref:Amino acid ABC transporter n=1 Tax=Salinicola rhizosphaerae TaxID=1443141 RepID=A0ABQ3DY38_9GAMM|nr:amino acid ABC transporter permease [Salinicola rhizosphaerae]GHB14603.1 amino acid ABC transporter [Salinicola rhizosphaerae]